MGRGKKKPFRGLPGEHRKAGAAEPQPVTAHVEPGGAGGDVEAKLDFGGHGDLKGLGLKGLGVESLPCGCAFMGGFEAEGLGEVCGCGAFAAL